VARFRNVSDDTRVIPEGAPQQVEPGGLFEVLDDRAEAFDEQPYFQQVHDTKGDV
jgi:hypothetical protein